MPNNAHVTLINATIMNEPKTTTTQNGSLMLTFNVAVATTKKQEGSQYGESDFYNVALFGKPAEMLSSRVKNKTKVTVIGTLQVGKPWKDNQGNTRTSLNVTATDVQIASGGNWNGGNNNVQNNNHQDTTEEDPF